MPFRGLNLRLLILSLTVFGCDSDSTGPDSFPPSLIGTRFILTGVSNNQLPTPPNGGAGFYVSIDSGWITFQENNIVVFQMFRSNVTNGSRELISWPDGESFFGQYTRAGDTIVTSIDGGSDTAFALPTAGVMLRFNSQRHPFGDLQGEWVFDRVGRTFNPLPAIQTVSPETAFVGGEGFDITVTGYGFLPGTYIKFGGHYLLPFEQSLSRLKAHVPAHALLGAGQAGVTISNPPPGGGTSNIVVVDVIHSR